MVDQGRQNPVKRRRAELGITQQDAAGRAGVSVATWRRFESTAGDAAAFDAFRPDNQQGLARALKLSIADLRQSLFADAGAGISGRDAPAGDSETSKLVRRFNRAFTGDPLTPAEAMALCVTVDFSAFAPTEDGAPDLDGPFAAEFAAYLKGGATIRDVPLLCDLPELALTHVNNHWLVRMGERIMRIGSELDKGRIPRVECLADEYAIWIVINNTDPPHLGDVPDMFPGLLGAKEIFGSDPDIDDADELNASEIRQDWIDRIASGLLPDEHAHDHRRYDLLVLEAYGQGVYDPADPRHPMRWFDRDGLRSTCDEAMAFARLSQEQQDEHTRDVFKRISEAME